MDDLASAFSGYLVRLLLPCACSQSDLTNHATTGSFNPMMMLNKSETSAARRLLQCTGLGLYMNDISSKFAPPATRAPDLAPDDFAARRTVVNQVAHWVRATYTTPNRGYKVDPACLPGTDNPVTPSKGAPPFFHTTRDSFTPTLLDSEIEKIDNVCAQGQEKQAGQTAVEAARKRVLGSKEDMPDVGDAWMNKNPRECANCQVVKDKALLKCSRCKLVNYCSKEW
ncbi:uncharacterized protein B0H18DRAFT_1120879 [Fomitopsis serialis]|uniref:uncharacterized protein n=1 Tax=Fomitopsis serialis TaxID=139415 RepID=UPI0020081DA9|nr:uncharacterized protein B0H18DRAFT_1120879 [Neoantrodia serialis]KAH9922489.1 hypothetical protein B0H18DRAFT_1120879 [Neoantrodia serialis]